MLCGVRSRRLGLDEHQAGRWIDPGERIDHRLHAGMFSAQTSRAAPLRSPGDAAPLASSSSIVGIATILQVITFTAQPSEKGITASTANFTVTPSGGAEARERRPALAHHVPRNLTPLRNAASLGGFKCPH